MATSTRWCFTLNNYRPCDIDDVEQITCKYLVYGKEVGESGTPHLQGFVTFATNKRLSGLKKILPAAHWERTRATSLEASTYCKKDGDFKEIGTAPTPGKRTDLDALCEALKEGKSMAEVSDLHPATYVRNYRGLAAYRALQEKPFSTDDVRGIWLYGPPGTGKSHHARLFASAIGDVYIKSQNKWFDGYAGAPVILLDDLDTSALGHHLKIWGDKYACTGEIKGGQVNLTHRFIIITSNYAPVDLWPAKSDPKNASLCEAITRRFTLIRVSQQMDQIPRLTKLLPSVDPTTAGENPFDTSI